MQADALARSASVRSSALAPATESITVLTVTTHKVTKTDVPSSWIEQILRFKKDGKEPDNPMAARRLRIPKAIITDNGAQFNNAKFKAYCQSYGIQLRFSSVVHPQTNGQIEVMNQAILEGLKRRISSTHEAWVDELPNVLWEM
ncbi:uncharacterized protein LOC135629246 [Musa acuminata AAA Group]|uniref:uncharacterized protein LOC135629246 n=1 Tax=Musa acuminata AAA Group TaxID=214697 RepID=UPI0031D8B96F